MRRIVEHIVACEAANLAVIVTDGEDDPAKAGPNCRYEISNFDATHNPSAQAADPPSSVTLLMQHGPVMMSEGANGVTEETLLAVILDRLRRHRPDGPRPCDFTVLATRLCEVALQCLQRRTMQRLERGIEGTDKTLDRPL